MASRQAIELAERDVHTIAILCFFACQEIYGIAKGKTCCV